MADTPAATPAAPATTAPAAPAPAAAVPAPAPSPVETAPAPAVAPAPVADAAPAPAAPAPEPAPAPAADAAAAAPAATPAPAPEFPPTALEAGKTQEAAAAAPADAAKPADGKTDPKADAKPDAAASPAEAKPSDAKDAPAAEAQAPITYEPFKMPEGFKPEDVSTERMTAFTETLGKHRLSQEVGQELLDLHVAELKNATPQIEKRLSDHQWEVFRTQQNSWLDEIKADPVIGGSRFETAMKTCAKVIEQYPGSPEERQALWNDLRATGMGNSPRFARMMHWLGDTFFKEGGMVPATPPKAPAQTRQQRGEARYAGTTPAR